MKSSFIILALSLSCLAAKAQRVEFFSPRTVHIIKDAPGVTAKDTKPSVVVTAKADPKVKVSVKNANGATIYQSSLLTVTVKDGKVTFADNQGNILMTEGESSFAAISNGPDKGAYKVGQKFSLDADEALYGVGLLQNGKMSQRGENRMMQQSNLEDFAHFYQTVKGYGIYWDNYSPTQLVTPEKGVKGEVTLESQVGKKVDYYFMYGGDGKTNAKMADGVIKEMRNLSGHCPMLPLWTYGFHQSRERYKTSEEILNVVRKYRDLKIPFDGIIQDWQYWGSNYTWNAMEFINEDFKGAQKMIDEIHGKNAHLSVSVWASFGPKTKQYKELNDKGLLYSFETWPQSGLPFWPPRMDYPSGVRVYDCYKKEARDIYWKYLSKMHDMGVDAWWMDSTDPDHHSYKDSDLDETLPVDANLQTTEGTDKASYRSVRNLFPFMCVSGVDGNQRATDKDKRVFILTRSFFAGQQRYGANTWSGDVGSSWDSFRKQVPICLNYTLCANPNVNTDIGGFFAGSYNKSWGDNSGTKNPQYQELYTRWMQFGLFCPMMRSHGTEVYRELYYYGKEGEPIYDALVGAVKMRYRLLPYIYSTSWQVSKNDGSFMRALVMDYRQDKNTWDNNRQFMFGQNLLVCPVVDPLYTKEKIVKTNEMTGWDRTENKDGKSGQAKVDWNEAKTFEVYLPAGSDWYDFWTGTKLNGGQTVKADAPISHSPLYVKAGSIIPMGQDLQYSNEKAWDNISITVYPGANADFTLYEDEGDNYNYENGQYATIALHWDNKSGKLTIGKRNGSFPGMLTNRTFIVKTVGGKEKSVNYSGKPISVKLK